MCAPRRCNVDLSVKHVLRPQKKSGKNQIFETATFSLMVTHPPITRAKIPDQMPMDAMLLKKHLERCVHGHHDHKNFISIGKNENRHATAMLNVTVCNPSGKT